MLKHCRGISVILAAFLIPAFAALGEAKSLFIVDGSGAVTVYDARGLKKIKSFRVPEDIFLRNPGGKERNRISL